MRTFAAIVMSLILSSVAFAESAADRHQSNSIAFEAGVRQQSGTTDITSSTAKSQMGYQIGGTVLIPINTLAFRSGLFYVNRPIQLSADDGSGSSTLSFTSFDVPLQLAYHLDDYSHVYGGVVLSMNVGADASNSGSYTTKITGTTSMMVPVQIGAAFKFAPGIGADFFFETMSGNVADHVSAFRSVGVNLLFTFD